MPYKNEADRKANSAKYNALQRALHPANHLCECGCGGACRCRFIHNHQGRRSLVERFWEKVNKNGLLPSEVAVREYPEIEGMQCWLWTASTNALGYGCIGANLDGEYKHGLLAHRVAWFLETGCWPEPLACHKCDNTSCVRFSHLFEGTDTENQNDRTIKGRTHSKLTTVKVLSIRKEVANGMLQKEAALTHNISRSVVSSIINNKAWKHVVA